MSTIQNQETNTTKYKTGYQYIELETPDEMYTVRLSEHAGEQWDKRTPAWSMSPEKALRQSTACVALHMDAFKSPFGDTTPDMVHYIAEWGTELDVEGELYEALFMERNETITTVYVRDFIENDPVQGYLDVLKEEYKNDI